MSLVTSILNVRVNCKFTFTPISADLVKQKHFRSTPNSWTYLKFSIMWSVQVQGSNVYWLFLLCTECNPILKVVNAVNPGTVILQFLGPTFLAFYKLLILFFSSCD